jgi:hypothetical protein
MRIRPFLLFFAAALCGCHSAPPPTACNGSDALCSRPYDQVAFAGTHNSFATTEEKYGSPDQTHTVDRQLADGIRVLHMETFPFDAGAPWVCHALCEIGGRPLADALGTIRAFLDAHPREVVTLLLETTKLQASDVQAAFASSGLLARVHPQALGAPWPTLGELIDRDERVVVLVDGSGGEGVPSTGPPPYPWYLDRWQFTEETPWNNAQPSDLLRCNIDRGTPGAPLLTVDHFLEAPVTNPAMADTVGNDPFFVDRIRTCAGALGHVPNFVLVDYYEVGDLFRVIDVLNGVASAPPVDRDAFPGNAPDAGGGPG